MRRQLTAVVTFKEARSGHLTQASEEDKSVCDVPQVIPGMRQALCKISFHKHLMRYQVVYCTQEIVDGGVIREAVKRHSPRTKRKGSAKSPQVTMIGLLIPHPLTPTLQ